MYHCLYPDSLPLLSESWDNATLLAQQVATVDAVVGPDTYSPDVKYIAQSATQDVGAFHRMSCASILIYCSTCNVHVFCGGVHYVDVFRSCIAGSEWILYISAFVGAEDVANRYVALSQFLFTCQVGNDKYGAYNAWLCLLIGCSS